MRVVFFFILFLIHFISNFKINDTTCDILCHFRYIFDIEILSGVDCNRKQANLDNNIFQIGDI